MTNTNFSDMTKAEKFATIINMISDQTEAVEFLQNEIALVNKRNSYKSSRPSKTQLSNESLKAEIRMILDNSESALSIAEIREEMEGNYSSQKISALLRLMGDNILKITSQEGKKLKTPLFTLA